MTMHLIKKPRRGVNSPKSKPQGAAASSGKAGQLPPEPHAFHSAAERGHAPGSNKSEPRHMWEHLCSIAFSREGCNGLDNFIEGGGRPCARPGRPWWFALLLDVVTFFRKRRVYLGLFVVVLAVALAIRAQDVFDSVTNSFIVAEPDRPGLTFLDKFNGGRRELPRKHPVVIIPGFITSALELWETRQTCLDRQTTAFSQSSFRQRMFSPSMIFLILTDPVCWMELFALDKVTGLDKDGIKVRPDSGFTSVDYFIPGVWVWAKVLINLADIGYDPQSIMVSTYDWRLSPQKAHERDGFFHSLHSAIKLQYKKTSQRSVVISHSYGTVMTLAFFKFAERQEAGFMNKYVAYYINIGGTPLGLPKAVSALLQGDVRDTLTIPRIARRVFDTFMTQSARYSCTRTWSCLVAMLPHGCEDEDTQLWTFPNGTIFGMRELSEIAIQECERTGHVDCAQQVRRRYETLDELPVLPQAPNTTVVCLYGVNKSTEVGYRIESTQGSDGFWHPNMSHNDVHTEQGVHLGNGDGTVPILSLGYMCRAPNGWKRNVGRVVTVEYPHDTQNGVLLNLRGGSLSGDHVDILGNYALIETILKIASGVDAVGRGANGTAGEVDPVMNKRELLHARVKDSIFSDIDAIIQRNQRCLAKPNVPIGMRSPGSGNGINLLPP